MQQIEQHARTRAANDLDYQCLVSDMNFRCIFITQYIALKNKTNNSTMQASLDNSLPTNNTTDPQQLFLRSFNQMETATEMQKRVIKEYEINTAQFQTKFKDTSYENLKKEPLHSRLLKYHNKIGCLGMKTFEFDHLSQPVILEAVLLYMIDSIEEKQRQGKMDDKPGHNFLCRIGMDQDVTSYYKAHRKSNLGGTSSALFLFNELKAFSFRRACMKAGLQTDVAAIQEAELKNAKTHPYETKKSKQAKVANRD